MCFQRSRQHCDIKGRENDEPQTLTIIGAGVREWMVRVSLYKHCLKMEKELLSNNEHHREHFKIMHILIFTSNKFSVTGVFKYVIIDGMTLNF